MNVTCHPEKVAYVPPGFDTTAIRAGGYRVIDAPGLPTAHLVDAGCGRSFTVDDDTSGWDVTTDAEGNIVERHRAVVCPYCGAVADHLSVTELA